MACVASALQQALRLRLAVAFEWNYGTRDFRERHVLNPHNVANHVINTRAPFDHRRLETFMKQSVTQGDRRFVLPSETSQTRNFHD